jgi:hypothetical protein
MNPIISETADIILEPLKKQSPEFQEICFLAARSAALRLAASNADMVALYIAHHYQEMFKDGVPTGFVAFVAACLVKEIEKVEKDIENSPIFKKYEESGEASKEFVKTLFKKTEGEEKNEGKVSDKLNSFLDQTDKNRKN